MLTHFPRAFIGCRRPPPPDTSHQRSLNSRLRPRWLTLTPHNRGARWHPNKRLIGHRRCWGANRIRTIDRSLLLNFFVARQFQPRCRITSTARGVRECESFLMPDDVVGYTKANTKRQVHYVACAKVRSFLIDMDSRLQGRPDRPRPPWMSWTRRYASSVLEQLGL